MADTRTRIINLPEATTLDPSMNFVEDSADGSGTRRVTYDTLKGAINQEVAVNLAPAYSNAATYNVGDLCTYQGTLYTCNTQISTAEDWTAAHWTLTNMASDLYQLKSELTKYDFTSMEEVISTFEQATYTVESGYYDLASPTTKKSNSNYSNIKLAVSEGDFLLITTQVVGSTSMAMLIEYDSDFNYLGYVNRGTDTRTQYTDVPYVVRSGVGFITVTSIYNTPVIKKGTLLDVANEIADNKAKIGLLNEGHISANITNIVTNGNFANGMATWTKNFCTSSISDNVLTLTGDGSDSRVNCANVTSINIGDVKYFVSVDVMVTDSDCTEILLRLAGGYASVSIINPVANKWYTLATAYKSNQSGTQSAFTLNAYYADNATQSGKVFKVKNAIGIQTNVDFGLGINPPLYKLMNIVSMNGFWSGTENVVIEAFSIGKAINNVENNYLLTSRNAYQSLRRPIVTFICDDGWQDDYDKLIAISEKHQVPFVSAIFDGSTMKEWNELYLQNELGWEFASHPENSPLADKATEADIRKAMVDTNEYLTNRGLKYYNIVYPYGSSDERVRRIAKEYYRCGCTTNAGINTGVVPSFYLDRWPMGYGNGDNNTLDFFKGKVDEAVTADGWLIFMLHPHMAQHTDALTQIVDDLIAYIKSIGVEIMTLNDGYNVFGNALECGDYIGGTDGLAISFDGQIANI